MVALALISISTGELRNCIVERVAVAEVPTDLCRGACAGAPAPKRKTVWP